jgi:hypothetical protein
MCVCRLGGKIRTWGCGGPWWGCGSIVPAVSGVWAGYDGAETPDCSGTCRTATSRNKQADRDSRPRGVVRVLAKETGLTAEDFRGPHSTTNHGEGEPWRGRFR